MLAVADKAEFLGGKKEEGKNEGQRERKKKKNVKTERLEPSH